MAKPKLVYFVQDGDPRHSKSMAVGVRGVNCNHFDYRWIPRTDPLPSTQEEIRKLYKAATSPRGDTALLHLLLDT